MQLPIIFIVTLDVSPTVFDKLTHEARKIACFQHTTVFDAPLGGIPSEYLDETYPAKTSGMGLLYGKNCMTLTSIVFD